MSCFAGVTHPAARRRSVLGALCSSILLAAALPVLPAHADAQTVRLKAESESSNTVTLVGFDELRSDPDRWDGQLVAMQGICDIRQDRGWLIPDTVAEPHQGGDLDPARGVGLRQNRLPMGCPDRQGCPENAPEGEAWEVCTEGLWWAVGAFRSMPSHLGEVELLDSLRAVLREEHRDSPFFRKDGR